MKNAISKNSLLSKDPVVQDELSRFSSLLAAQVKKTLETLAQGQIKTKDLILIEHLLLRLVQFATGDLFKTLAITAENDALSPVDEFGLDAQFVEKIKPLFDFLYRQYWRINTTGINNVPNEGRALIVGNHSGAVPYDGAMLAAAVANEHPLRRDARFLVEDFVFHMPMLGTFMYRIGGIRACPENAERLLNHEHLVIVFPEGVKGIGKYYSQRYQLQRFGRAGFIKLCLKTRSPLIPVGIVGAEEIHPVIFKSNILAKFFGLPYIPITPFFPLFGLFGALPLPTKWHIHFGTPIPFAKMPPSTLDDELTVHKHSENVRCQIQTILIDLLKKRTSVWN